ncbi:MAG: Rne/Rng family ribonuclease [Terriglobales bacterium]
MTREMYVSSTPHETKVAITEDDQLAEIFFERENEYTLAGSIYKGRVTRVLPGMQSAFVDIGLERDAFLYVSDFLEVQDEDEEFDELPVSSPEAFVTNRPPQERKVYDFKPAPAEPAADVVEKAEADEEPAEGNTQEYAEAESPEEVAREEGAQERFYRGRRRRRGRRGRGFPASKFAARENSSAGEEAESPHEDYVAPTGYQPIILPGESLSKYQHSEAPTGARDEAKESPLTLPGESISKYQRAEAPGSGSIASDQPTEQHYTEPVRRQEETSPPPRRERRAAPLVLPGESISKYRHISEARVEPPPQPQEDQAQEAATFVIESEPFSETLEKEIEHQSPNEPPFAAIAAQQKRTEEHGEQAVQGSAATSRQSGAEEQKQAKHEKGETERFEQMNVASTFGGNAAEAPDAEARRSEQTGDEPRSEQRRHEPAFTAAGQTLEHEEIEGDEETDLHPSAEELSAEEDEQDEHLELEEETLERGGGSRRTSEHAAGGESEETVEAEDLTSAVEDSDIERATMEVAYEDENGTSEDDETEFEEQELVEEEEPEFRGDEHGELTRAELRASTGTAGYQQRVSRPDYERVRRERFRRGRRGMRPPRRDAQRHNVQISDLLKEGQEVLIQIAKEPIGKKGARITSHIALPGRFLVYMPTVNHIGVSRKITSDEERQRLKRIMMSERDGGHGGFIVRTAAEGITEEELRADIRFLKNLWSEIRNRADNSKAPALIYHDLNLVERILRDQVNHDFAQVWVDTEQEYERILRFANRFQPSLVRKVKLYTKNTPLFEQFNIQEEINKALKSKVWLKSGGYIVINQTEALVAIDVNTGKYVGKTARLEDTIVKTNVDAIKEIVRQIRLRDLGGIIVIDFIDMDERRNRQKVMQALEEALKTDRSPSKVLAFNDFGLVAITRKRVKQSLERTLGMPCPHCSGTGLVKSIVTTCNEIYTELRKMARQLEPDEDVVLRVHPEIAKALKSNNARWLQDYEELVGRTVIVKSDPLLHEEQFDIH